MATSSNSQWNQEYGCKGTVASCFALIDLVAWKHWLDSTLRESSLCTQSAQKVRSKWHGFKGIPSHSSCCFGGPFPQYFGCRLKKGWGLCTVGSLKALTFLKTVCPNGIADRFFRVSCEFHIPSRYRYRYRKMYFGITFS